jgi:hypothetical protein
VAAALRAALLVSLPVVVPAPAFADATLFVGANTTSAPHPTVGIAVGLCCRRTVGFEVEYAGTLGEGTPDTPNLATVTVNLLVQRPLSSKTHFYIVGGLGAYIESNGSGSAENAYNLGGGLKSGSGPRSRSGWTIACSCFANRRTQRRAPRILSASPWA